MVDEFAPSKDNGSEIGIVGVELGIGLSDAADACEVVAGAFCGEVEEFSWLISTGVDWGRWSVCLCIGECGMFVGSVRPDVGGEDLKGSLDIGGE